MGQQLQTLGVREVIAMRHRRDAQAAEREVRDGSPAPHIMSPEVRLVLVQIGPSAPEQIKQRGPAIVVPVLIVRDHG